MGTMLQVTFDAADPHALASWWAALLGYDVEHNDDMVQGLLDQGVITDADVVEHDGRLHFADAVAIRDPEGVAPRLLFQRVPEAKVAKNRVHLDIPVQPDLLESEVDRLRGLGASLLDYREHPGHRWAVMQDPEGNEFCLH